MLLLQCYDRKYDAKFVRSVGVSSVFFLFLPDVETFLVFN